MPSVSDDRPLSLLLRRLRRAVPLSSEDVRAVEGLPIIVRDLPVGQDIVREADSPSQACLILNGWTCGYKLIEGGRRQILSLHLAGDVPDLQNLNMAVADFSLGTLTKATVAFIPHKNLRALTLHNPSLAMAFWHLTLIEAGIFRQWMTGLGRRSATERLAHLFCEVYTKQRAIGDADETGCPFPITQTDLADVLGMTSVHVNRVLKELRGEGLLTIKARRLIIPDRQALASFANFDPAYLRLDAIEPT